VTDLSSKMRQAILAWPVNIDRHVILLTQNPLPYDVASSLCHALHFESNAR
jgi:hypothetical protein